LLLPISTRTPALSGPRGRRSPTRICGDEDRAPDKWSSALSCTIYVISPAAPQFLVHPLLPARARHDHSGRLGAQCRPGYDSTLQRGSEREKHFGDVPPYTDERGLGQICRLGLKQNTSL